MNNNKNLISLFQKIAKVFESLDIKEGKDELVKNLVASFYITFSRLMASDEKVSPYLIDFSGASDADPNKLFEYLDSKNVDYQEILVSAQKETLQSFVTELTPDLTPEKVEGLNKIISEEV